MSHQNPAPAACPHCHYRGALAEARFCPQCGKPLDPQAPSGPQISVEQDVQSVQGGEVIGVEIEQVDHVDIALNPSESAWRSLLRALTPRFLQTPADWAAFLVAVALALLAAFAALLMVRTDFPGSLVALVMGGAALECALLLWLRARERKRQGQPALRGKAALPRYALCAGLAVLPLAVAAPVARHILWPVAFQPQDFGIAVARFDPGVLSERLVEAQKVRRAIIQALEEAKQGKDEWAHVRAGRVGLARDSAAAVGWAQRVGADVVIWGEVDPIGGRDVSMYFEVVQTEDRGSSPLSPHVIPVTRGFTHVPAAVNVPYSEIQKQADREAAILIGYCLGLEAYYRADYGAARREFGRIVSEVEKGASCSQLPAGEKEKVALAYYYLGRSYQRLGQLVVGEEWLKRAQQCAPHDPAIPLSIAYGYNSMGQKEETRRHAELAVDLATTLLVDRPDHRDARYDRGLALALLGRYADAVRDFDALLQKDPDGFYIAYLSAGQVHLAAGETSRAIERLQQAAEQAGSNGVKRAWASLLLAEAHEQAGDPARAGELYESAAALAPQVAWMHFAQGRFLAQRGDAEGDAQTKQALYERAEASYRQMVDCSYDKPWAWGVLGAFLRGRGRLEEAIEYYERIRQERPGDALARTYLAELYQETEREEASRAEYEAALAIDPGSAYSQVSYCRSLTIWRDYERAAEHCCVVVRRDPTDCVARFILGRIYEATAQPALARSAYEGLVAPSSPCAWLQAAAQERLDALPAPEPGAPPGKLLCENP